VSLTAFSNGVGPAIAFFAQPADVQAALLPGIPRDRGAADFYTAFAHNPLWIAARGLTDCLGGDDTVPEEHWRQSVGLPAGWHATAISELRALLSILSGQILDWQILFTQRALADRPEWRIARRLALASVEDLGLPRATTSAELTVCVRDLARWLKRS